MDNTFDYQTFLQNKHNTFKTPDLDIERVIKKATGSNILTKTRLIRGETNEVYDIELTSSGFVILRIFHGDQNRFINEEWAMKEVEKHGVPVPHIILIEEEKKEDSYRIYCVMTKIPGIPLLEIKEYKDREFTKNIITEAGTLLTSIHKVHPQGFGELLNRGIGEHKSYKEWLLKIISHEKMYSEAAEKNSLDTSIIENSIHILKDNIDLFENEMSVLCHSDFGPKHLMVEKGHITGIIDFGNCHGASPVHDFAWWDYWQQKDDELMWLKEGYTNKDLFNEAFDRKFHILRLLIGLELLWWNNNIGHLGGIELSKKSIPNDVSFFN